MGTRAVSEGGEIERGALQLGRIVIQPLPPVSCPRHLEREQSWKNHFIRVGKRAQCAYFSICKTHISSTWCSHQLISLQGLNVLGLAPSHRWRCALQCFFFQGNKIKTATWQPRTWVCAKPLRLNQLQLMITISFLFIHQFAFQLKQMFYEWCKFHLFHPGLSSERSKYILGALNWIQSCSPIILRNQNLGLIIEFLCLKY